MTLRASEARKLRFGEANSILKPPAFSLDSDVLGWPYARFFQKLVWRDSSLDKRSSLELVDGDCEILRSLYVGFLTLLELDFWLPLASTDLGVIKICS